MTGEGGNSASKFRIISFNANSIGKQPKRRQVLLFMRKKSPDILIVVDTRLAKDIENAVKAEWGGPSYFSSFNSQSRGVAIFIKKDLPIKIIDQFSDKNGNILSILVELEGRQILIQGIYGPNKDEPNFYSDECFLKLNEWCPSHAIFAGDWNIALDPNIDTCNYINYNNQGARAELLNKMNELELIDVFREFHPLEKKFTWKQWGTLKFSRLDYFLTSNSMLPYVQKVEILQKCFSDHSPISLEIDFSRFKRGRGFWKMNNSLLSDKDYVDIIKNTIKRVTCQYAIVNNDINFFQNSANDIIETFIEAQTPETLQSLPLQINAELFLDTLMMEIRRDTILFSAKNKRERNAREQLLNHDIEILENQIQTHGDISGRLSEELDAKKHSLEEIIKYQAQGAFIRSRAEYKVDGEKPTRLFCALEKLHGVQKYVPQLFVKDKDGYEALITDQSDIEKEIEGFYSNLYENKDSFIENNSIEEFLGPQNCQNIPKVTNAEKSNMEGKITVDEMSKYLKKI